jgi:hypothetical protein
VFGLFEQFLDVGAVPVPGLDRSGLVGGAGGEVGQVLTVVDLADDAVIEDADGLYVGRPRRRVAGGAFVCVVTPFSAW